MGGATCSGPECDRAAERGGLCWAHLKQRQRGHALRPLAEKLSLKERALEAGNAWLEAESDEEYRAAEVRFLRAAGALLREQGWRPPKGARGVGGKVSTSGGKVRVEQLALAFTVDSRRARSVRR